MSAAPSPQDVLGHITLVTGPEEFLGERAIAGVRAAVRRHDPEAELSETLAASLTMAELGDLAAPSLFSTTRCVVVRRLEDLPEESAPGILDYAAAPADDIALVLAHSGGPRGSGLLGKLRKVATVTEVKSAPLTNREFPGFVAQELKGHQVQIDPAAADFLVQAVGQDLRALSSAASQLASDFEGKPLTVEMVRQYFGGRAEAKSFVVADQTLYGHTAKALEELRWALDRGTAPVLVTSALATGLRGLAKFMTAQRGLRNADLARDVGVPPWKIDVLRRQSHGWDVDGVGRAIRTVARADADIKGQASDPAYALEKMVLDVVRSRPAR